MLETQAGLFRQSKQREYRQLDLILQLISAYKKNTCDLGTLDLSTESLLNQLREADDEWISECWGYWEVLEVEYSFQVAHEKPFLSEDEQIRVDNAVNKIEQLVKERIKLYEPYLDDAECE